MEKMLLAIFHFFEKRRLAFFVFFLSSFFIFLFFASRIRLEEDISKILPRDQKIDQLTKIFQNARFADKLVFSLSLKDTSAVLPDSLVGSANDLAEGLGSQLKPFISRIEYKVSDSLLPGLLNTVSENLPLFLNEKDYEWINRMINPDSVRELLGQDIRALSSPAGIALKQILGRDPMGISFLPLKRLSQLQVDENFELFDNAILTKDRKHLLIFITPAFPSNNTGKNGEMIRALDQWINDSFNPKYNHIVLDYFGANAVSEGNARQLRKDSLYTLGIILVFLVLFIGWHFRRKRAPLLILILALIWRSVFSGLHLFYQTLHLRDRTWDRLPDPWGGHQLFPARI